MVKNEKDEQKKSKIFCEILRLQMKILIEN